MRKNHEFETKIKKNKCAIARYAKCARIQYKHELNDVARMRKGSEFGTETSKMMTVPLPSYSTMI